MPAHAAYPRPVEALIAAFRRMPGVGKRTAERLALALLEWSPADLSRFGNDIGKLRERISFCETCGHLAEGRICGICASPDRDRAQICVVEHASQVPVIENAGCYRGLYHVLGGRIVPLEGKGPEDIRIAELHRRVAAGDVRELILATSPDLEGEATASFIAAELAGCGLHITRIAAGVPVGADLSFADSATIAMAMGGRQPLTWRTTGGGEHASDAPGTSRRSTPAGHQ